MDPISFILGMLATGGLFLIVDLVRNRRSLRDARLEIAELKKRSDKAKKKDKKKKHD